MKKAHHSPLADTYHAMFFDQQGRSSSKKPLTSVISFSLKVYNDLTSRRITGAVEQNFCSDKIQLAA